MKSSKKTFDDALQKNIRMVSNFLIEVHQDRKDLLGQMYELYKQNHEFERMMQMSLLRMLSIQEFSASMGFDAFKKMTDQHVDKHVNPNNQHTDNAYQ